MSVVRMRCFFKALHFLQASVRFLGWFEPKLCDSTLAEVVRVRLRSSLLRTFDESGIIWSGSRPWSGEHNGWMPSWHCPLCFSIKSRRSFLRTLSNSHRLIAGWRKSKRSEYAWSRRLTSPSVRRLAKYCLSSGCSNIAEEGDKNYHHNCNNDEHDLFSFGIHSSWFLFSLGLLKGFPLVCQCL